MPTLRQGLKCKSLIWEVMQGSIDKEWGSETRKRRKPEKGHMTLSLLGLSQQSITDQVFVSSLFWGLQVQDQGTSSAGFS